VIINKIEIEYGSPTMRNSSSYGPAVPVVHSAPAIVVVINVTINNPI
jgi:hypothetical protein